YTMLAACLAGTTLRAAEIVFEPNRGQAPSEVQWLARGPGYQVALTSDGAILALQESAKSNAPEVARVPETAKLRLAGGRAWNHIEGLEPTGGVSNYFTGNQPEQWHTDIPHYSRVKAASVYEGIDIVFYGRDGLLEYDFAVSPGADPRQIQLEFE